MHTYPIYLTRLHEKKTVLIGGNHEAERKVEELLEREAVLTIISDVLTNRLKKLALENAFEWIPRRYREGDLEGAFLVIAAEFEGNENERIYREAEERGILVNVMDDIPHANFSFGSIVKRGPLTLSISTSGAAPTLAVRLRQRFEKEFGKEYELFLTLLQKLRKPMSRHYDDFETRKNLWYELIDSDALDLFREQRTEEAIERIREILGTDVVDEVVLDHARQ
jgi:precorrin-2 dehydrogenase / sirohydrochlorin ferrochelatase